MIDLGCEYAINLDGGGSTKALDKDGKSITSVLTNRPGGQCGCHILKKENIPSTSRGICV